MVFFVHSIAHSTVPVQQIETPPKMWMQQIWRHAHTKCITWILRKIPFTLYPYCARNCTLS